MNILLVCACGASTGMLTTAMKRAMNEDEKNYLIEAKSLVEAKETIGKYDVVLLAPQIRYQRKTVEKIANPINVPVMDIDSTSYAMCDGRKVLDDVKKFLKSY